MKCELLSQPLYKGSREYDGVCTICGKSFKKIGPNKKRCSDECDQIFKDNPDIIRIGG